MTRFGGHPASIVTNAPIRLYGRRILIRPLVPTDFEAWSDVRIRNGEWHHYAACGHGHRNGKWRQHQYCFWYISSNYIRHQLYVHRNTLLGKAHYYSV